MKCKIGEKKGKRVRDPTSKGKVLFNNFLLLNKTRRIKIKSISF